MVVPFFCAKSKAYIKHSGVSPYCVKYFIHRVSLSLTPRERETLLKSIIPAWWTDGVLQCPLETNSIWLYKEYKSCLSSLHIGFVWSQQFSFCGGSDWSVSSTPLDGALLPHIWKFGMEMGGGGILSVFGAFTESSDKCCMPLSFSLAHLHCPLEPSSASLDATSRSAWPGEWRCRLRCGGRRGALG